MGITGLLPQLKGAIKETDLEKLRGQRAAIDVYSWLHMGLITCAQKLFDGEDSDLYVKYCMDGCDLLLQYDIKPYMVFDGCHLPAKSETDAERKRKRQQSQKEIREGKARGEKPNYFKLAASIDVTPAMARKVVDACRERGIDYVVAPYEADAQMAYLARNGIVDFVICEDSDLIVFGVEKILFKWKRKDGKGQLFNAKNLEKALGKEFADFERFRAFAILSGCDYLPSLPQIGPTRALNFVKKAKNFKIPDSIHNVYSDLKMSMEVPREYVKNFLKAIDAFEHQLVFCPDKKELVPLTPYPVGKSWEDVRFAGDMLPAELARELAIGNINVHTMKEFEITAELSATKEENVNGKKTKVKVEKKTNIHAETDSKTGDRKRSLEMMEKDDIEESDSSKPSSGAKKLTHREVRAKVEITTRPVKRAAKKPTLAQLVAEDEGRTGVVKSKYFANAAQGVNPEKEVKKSPSKNKMKDVPRVQGSQGDSPPHSSQSSVDTPTPSSSRASSVVSSSSAAKSSSLSGSGSSASSKKDKQKPEPMSKALLQAKLFKYRAQ